MFIVCSVNEKWIKGELLLSCSCTLALISKLAVVEQVLVGYSKRLVK